MSSSTETAFAARRRRRASMACLSCRKSRIRCKVEPGQNACNQCQQISTECYFDTRDGRKNRTNSNAVANELNKRIQYLESLLRHNGREQPLAESSNPSCRETPSEQHEHPRYPRPMETDSDSHSTPCHDEEPSLHSNVSEVTSQTHSHPASSPRGFFLSKAVPRPVRFDMASGRCRFFGPTTNMQILSRPSYDKVSKPSWPISTLVRDLAPETHDYILGLFFDRPNSVVHLVHKSAFLDDLKSGGLQYYSNFLHMTMLAQGYRYADKGRADIKKLACPGPNSSTFHTKAKKMAELELAKPGGLTSLQAFFLLGDLESGIGRDDTGWIFTGIAFRLLFDIGLHVDPTEMRLSEREVQIRHMVLWACIINDVYWGLLLGRPTMIKSSDIAPTCLTKDFGPLIESQPGKAVYEKSIVTHIYEALLRLMDILGPLCETSDLRKHPMPEEAYIKIEIMDRKLNSWYDELPEGLQWSVENIRSAPPSFYLLHTQYHAALILLHRIIVHRAMPNQISQASTVSPSSSAHFSDISRSACVSNAIRIAEIVNQYRERYTSQRFSATGLQHIGTAATALMAGVSTLPAETDRPERQRLLAHLRDIREIMREMHEMYQPALLMSTVVDHFIRDYGGGGRLPDSNINPDTRTSDPRIGSVPVQRSGLVPTTTSSTTETGLAVSAFQSSSSSSISPPSSFSNTRAHDPGTAAEIDISDSKLLQTQFDSGGGLPLLPNSWLDEMNWEEDTEFLNLMGLKELQEAGLVTSGNGFGLEGFGLIWDTGTGVPENAAGGAGGPYDIS